MHRTRARGLIAVLALLSACGRSAPPAPAVVVAPTPVPAPAPVAAPLRVSIARTVAERHYDVRASARIERDSAGRKDEQRVESQGLVSLALQRAVDGALRGSGRVDAYAVRVDGAGVPSPVASATTRPASPAVVPSVLFDVVLDAMSLRVVTRPPLANECDRPESGATTLVRDLVVRVPASLSSGDRWRDSSVSLVCRAGMPITVRTQHEYSAVRIDGAGSGAVVTLHRTTTTRLEGKVGSAWRTLELSGTGSGADDLRVEAGSGALLQLDGEATTSFQLTDRTRPSTPRVQRVTQQLTLHVTPRN